MDPISDLIRQIDIRRMRDNLFHLAKDPIPCRVLNVTLPGHSQCTLYEADDHIAANMESFGYAVEREPIEVQAFRCDPSKPLAHQYSRPFPEDPWYTAYNLYSRKVGQEHPQELLVLVAHKDSQSWIEGYAPGAYDNGVGTVAVMEIARVLAAYPSQRSIWFLFCNEEHTPWTSAFAAQTLANSPYSVVGVLNVDSLGGKSAKDQHQRLLTSVTRYSSPEGEALADLMAELNTRYHIGVSQNKFFSERPNDDDGSFINAGIPRAVLNVGSMPYGEPYYHTTEDIPEHVDWENVRLATMLSLAWIVHLDQSK
jgi:hypothetical protein